MRKLASVLLLCLCAAAAADSTQAPASKPFQLKSTLVDPVPAGGFADIVVTVPKGASVIWRISPTPVQRATDLPVGRLIFGGVPGTTYVATAIVVDFDAKTVTDADYTIPFAGAPPPQPQPQPQPTPNPTPAVDAAWVIVVYETQDKTPELAKALGDTAYWTALKVRGISWRHYDKDDPSVTSRGYLKYANQVGLPAALFLDKTGKVLKQVKFSTTADIDSALKKG